LETVLKNDNVGSKLSRCELALMLLVDLVLEINEELRPHVAKVLFFK